MPDIQPPRGTVDILPGDTEKWQQLEQRLHAVLKLANYREIRMPIFEHTELFKRGVGETTDIVNKEMYTFNDKSDRSLTLRPEGTAGAVRAFLSNSEWNRKMARPTKLWYCGPMFRYERPQTGRQRQFHQTGVEAFGSEGPAIDAEVIVLAVDCIHALGIKDFQVHLNSIGCTKCRPVFREKLKEALRQHLPNLCADCQDRFERNPLRMLDCKHEACQKYYTDLPTSLDNLCGDCSQHWAELLKLLDSLGISQAQGSVRINPRLVRGLDYYGRTVFELITDDPRLGAQSTILAGGRYDYLFETLGGAPTPAVGWACGMERLSLLLDEFEAAKPVAFVISSNTEAGMKLVTEIRRAGFTCETDYPPTGTTPRSLKRQFEQAVKSQAGWTITLGEDELAAGQATVKDMSDRNQSTIPVENVIGFLDKRMQEKVYNKG